LPGTTGCSDSSRYHWQHPAGREWRREVQGVLVRITLLLSQRVISSLKTGYVPCMRPFNQAHARNPFTILIVRLRDG
jgi:hypothetical protein